MNTPRPETYDYAGLSDRIEQALGERPSQSSLRAAGVESNRPRLLRRRPNLTTGMPRPLPSPSRTAKASFSSSEVEAWLAQHPRRVWDQAIETVRERLAAGDELEVVVAHALRSGLSWSVITQVVNERNQMSGQGRQYTKAGIHKRFRHLDQQE